MKKRKESELFNLSTSNNTLIEQYKLFVEMTDNLSQRRITTNSVVISMCSGLIGIEGLLLSIDKSVFFNVKTILIVLSILGMVFCLSWIIIITRYKNYSKVRFDIIQQMEKKLEVCPYTYEWIKHKEVKGLFSWSITNLELLLPIIYLLFFLIIIFIQLL